MEKKVIPKKLNRNGGENKINFKSPVKPISVTSKLEIINKNDINLTIPEKNMNYLENNNNINYNQGIDEKDNKLFKGFLQKLNKIGEFGFNEKNTYTFPISDKDLNIIDDNNIYENNNNNQNKENRNKNKKRLQAEYDAIRAKERKEMMKSIAKYAIPIVVLIAAFILYFFVYKKKKIGK